jgi:2-aminoadipate transaminase
MHAIARAARERLTEDADPLLLQYGTMAGPLGFRESLAAYLSAGYGHDVAADELVVTGGISTALGLAAEVFSAPGQCVVMGDPTYFLARGIFETLRLETAAVAVDEHGLNVDALELELRRGLNVSLVYCIPSFHNPCGVNLAPDRARRLVELAQQYDFMVLADEPYVLLHFGDAPPPCMMSFDGGRNRVVSLGSFSKLLGPGLRLGWVHGAQPVVERFTEHGVLRSGGGLNPIASELVHATIESGFLREHVGTLRETLQERAAALVGALRVHVPDATFERPDGGYFCWVDLGVDVDDRMLLRHCLAEHGVGFTPGSACTASGEPGRHVRLSFSFYEARELEEAVERLARGLGTFSQL